MALPYLIFADKKGKIYSHPYLRMALAGLGDFSPPPARDLVKLPQGSTFFFFPGRRPVGYNLKTGAFEVVNDFAGREVFAACAFLPPAYLRLGRPAYVIVENMPMPLWAYTAAGFYAGSFWAAARRVDSRIRQSPRFYDARIVKRQVNKFIKNFPENRLYRHLAHCALNYNCLAAKNLFLERWEAPLPTARRCNAACLGCLSHQACSGFPASHARIKFLPSAGEIVQVAAHHLKKAPEAIVSFGQGCEGEPLLEARTIASAVKKIRRSTIRGTINMNTNASLPKAVELLARAGVDSFRVSLNSPSPALYNIYFKPRGYSFSDVCRSIAVAKKHKKFVSLNLFVFPGVSDSEREAESLLRFIGSNPVDMIQWRNLNIDPRCYLSKLPFQPGSCIGVPALISRVKRKYPKLKHGYFNLPKEFF